MSEGGKVKLNIFQKVEKASDLVLVNLLFVVSCIPIITIGAAITALYSFTTKLVLDHEGGVWKSYWKAFAKNFKPATKVWIVLLLLFAIMYFEFIVSYTVAGLALAAVLGIMGIQAVALSFILPIIFPLIARYENTTFNYFKNSILICVSNMGSWFYLFFIWVLPIALYATNETVFYYSWFLWLVLLIGVLAYASSMVIVKLYKKLEDAEAEREAEAKKTSEKKTKKEKIQKNLGVTSGIASKANSVNKIKENIEDEKDK